VKLKQEKNMARPLWQLLLDLYESNKELNINCEDCFTVLEFYADELAAGINPDELEPSIKRHISQCFECTSKFSDWMSRLDK
jgi:hypothetical protein